MSNDLVQPVSDSHEPSPDSAIITDSHDPDVTVSPANSDHQPSFGSIDARDIQIQVDPQAVRSSLCLRVSFLATLLSENIFYTCNFICMVCPELKLPPLFLN